MIEDIYTTVPEKAYTEGEYEEQKKDEIKNFLEEQKGKFFTAATIAKEVGLPLRGTNVEVRKYVTQLIEIDGVPIVAGGKGFSYAIHKNQIKFYVESLQDRIKGIQRRINCLNTIGATMREEDQTELGL